MKTTKSLFTCLAACALMGVTPTVKADATYTIDPSANWLGFMNIFELPSNGGGYVEGHSWGVQDLVATFSGGTLTLTVNSVNDPSSYWYTPSGQPGATGNKIMDANMYQQFDGSLSGETVTFKGVVVTNTLTTNSSYTSVAFIKDFAPDYSSFVSSTVTLTPGAFSVSLATVNDPARHVQFGFETIGPDVWITDATNYGVVQITAAASAPTAVALTPHLSGGTLSLSFPTQTGYVYTVQTNSNLSGTNWGTLTTTNGTGASAVVTAATGNPQVFYRLSIQ
jgi:hypothetical protein